MKEISLHVVGLKDEGQRKTKTNEVSKDVYEIRRAHEERPSTFKDIGNGVMNCHE